MQDLELCEQLLSLEDGWSISAIELDEPSHRLDITIRFGTAKKRALFKRSANKGDQVNIALRHLPIAGYRTYLHVPKPGTVESNKLWAPAGSRFTHEMQAYIVNALNSCRSVSAVAKLVGITPAEAREISERTGAGGDFHEEERPVLSTPMPKPEMEVEHHPARSFELDSSSLPVETHPNWQRFINGDIPIQSSAVGLQMLLQRVRQQIANNPSEVTRLSSARLLRQYFIKNQAQHPVEIAMLTGAEIAPVAGFATTEIAAASAIPSEIDPCWQQIIDGEFKIATNEVGLQMMLERVRQSVERNPSETTRMAGIRILRQFFTKHQNRLRDELEQMGVSLPAVIAVEPAAGQELLAIPAENHPVWMKLINGQMGIDTNMVALQMMLERIRLSVERNPSDATKQAGIKILRQFFQKHQGRLHDEIAQLTGIEPRELEITQKITRVAGIPAENDLCWQSLIDGLIQLNTDNVALQMMLERIRLSVERNPSAPNISAGIKLLRQFFVKHHTRLLAELTQLGGDTSDIITPIETAETRQVAVPPESHPSWQRLINGDLELKTDVVALKMMLERIRISISNNPSEASRLAGAKILRQYFLKHQNKHRAEIDQLLAA